ncbi:MAG: glycine cleavage system protein H [Candidatus Marinimicrobia bacterium]|nr:glycine cleavage system protein H [Candidatus Neomarinimicrobiota bacterium]|tara:strand:- start:5433 stop:5810 length:378 start_codon:yes stop_codon:yes gene_type:complete
MNIPENLKYTKEHEWIRVEENFAYVGITDYAQGELGDIVFVELPNLEEEFNQNDIFGTIEAVKTLADLFIPISGKIVAVNEDLEGQPELINTSPYEEGWIVKIEVTNKEDLESLMNNNNYKELIS